MKIKLILFLIIGYTYACTIGIIDSEHSSDGYPILFKVRDASYTNNEFRNVAAEGGYGYSGHFNTDGTYPWMGINEVGFAVVQAYAANFPDSSSFGENGYWVNLGLRNCETVEDFEELLDRIDDRELMSIFMVADCYGNAACFEVDNYTHTKYNPDENGIILRTNFAYAGDSTRMGEDRFIRAQEILDEAIALDSLDIRYISNHLINDLVREDVSPYPLPYLESSGELPMGWIETNRSGLRSICSNNTVSAGVIRGVDSLNPSFGVMFSIYGPPVVSVPFPLFPAIEYSNEYLYRRLFSLVSSKIDSAFSDTTHETWMNTNTLSDSFGNGILSYSEPIINWVIDTTLAQLTIWNSINPSEMEISDFQDYVLGKVINNYQHGEFGIMENLTQEETIVRLEIVPNPVVSSCIINTTNNSTLYITDIYGNNIDKITQSGENILYCPKMNNSGKYFITDGNKKLGSFILIR